MGEKVKFDKCCIRKCKYLPESIKLFGLDPWAVPVVTLKAIKERAGIE